MATQSAKGSILFKLLILALLVALVFVILIPAEIWKQETKEMTSAQYNMTSIYEAEKFYHRMTKRYTTNKDSILTLVREDSTLKQVQQLVNHTQDLRNELDNFLQIPYVRSLIVIDQNVTTMSEDLVDNMRYFSISDEITTTAQDLQMKLGALKSDLTYPNLIASAQLLDTLYQLRRDLSDYNLQTAASRSSDLTSRLVTVLPNIEFASYKTEWDGLFKELTTFRKSVDETDISKQTSVAARIREFSANVDRSVKTMVAEDKNTNTDAVSTANTNLANLYDAFLQDYIVTSKRALYKLSIEDSMVLYISDENFYSSGNNEPYLLKIASDSSDITIESPMLVGDLLEQAQPVAEKIAAMTFYKPFIAYRDSLNAILQKGVDIKSKLRRNIDITIKNKEIEEKVTKYISGSEFTASNDLQLFVEKTANSKSYSELKQAIENARNAISIFDQIYSADQFSNVDSINTSIAADLEEYNTILSGIRRLPKGISKYEQETAQLGNVLSAMKQKTSETDSENLNQILASLEEALLFANEGKKVRVYGVFERSKQNYGFINRSEKSWEEE